MTFIDPALRPLLNMSRGANALAGKPIDGIRAGIEARARERGPGPEIDFVTDDAITSADGHAVPVRIYRPNQARGTVVALHGGGWVAGSIASFDDVARHIANDSGQAVVSVDYRLAPEHPFPAALEDGWAVLKWAAEIAHGDILPSGPLMLLGDSAGGNLAAALALIARDAGAPQVALQVLIYPLLDAWMENGTYASFGNDFYLTTADVEHTFRSYGVDDQVSPDDWRVSPLRAPSLKDVAPALLISAEFDPSAGDARSYHERLAAEGVPSAHVTYSGVTHLFFGMRGSLTSGKMAQLHAAAAIRDCSSR